MCEHAGADVEITDVSARYAQLALQGPLAETILQRLAPLALGSLKKFNFEFADVASIGCLISRTGYTGEDGFELYCVPEEAEALWTGLLEAGSADGLMPAGLGARDTLRLEKGFPLYGHELDESTTPLEAGLDWVVKLSKPSFMGREALLRQQSEGVKRRLVGMELQEPGIARAGYTLYRKGQVVGRVTSGTKSPTLGKSIALGYVSREIAKDGEIVEIDIRGRKSRAKIVPLPFARR